MTCTDPIPFETLVALWAGEHADAEAVEDHLFACDDCAATSAGLDRLMGSLLVQIPPVITHAMKARFEARGFKIENMAFEDGAHGRAEIGADLDLMVFALRADLAQALRVDVEVLAQDGTLFFSFAHVPFDAARGEVLVACQQHYRQSPVADTPEFRLYAVGPGGERRRVGSYSIEHVWAPL